MNVSALRKARFSKKHGLFKCVYCGEDKHFSLVHPVPENASSIPKWFQRFGNLFFFQINLTHKSYRFVCKRHLVQVQDRTRDTMNSRIMMNWPRIRLPVAVMQDNKDFELLDVKQEQDIEPEGLEDGEEEKPPILAPPPTIPVFRGAPPAKRRRTTFYQPPDDEASTSEYSHVYQCVDRYNEEVSARFLIGNGLNLTKIEDDHFKDFLNQLNPTRAPPEACHLATKASCEVRAPCLLYSGSGPLSVSIEAIRKNDEVFLSISVHFYGPDKERRNDVHFEKIILADYEGRNVADRLRRVIDPKKTYNYQITSIVSPNVRMVQLLWEHSKFKNKFICFFSYLTNIARDVIAIDEYKTALKVLRKYIDALKNRPELVIKMRRLQQSTHFPSTDVPNLDVPIDWLSTLQFLTTCGILNESLLNLHEGWCMPEYLSISQENALANLSDFLTVLCQVATEICSQDSCVSQVLHSMSIINNAIENCGIRTARSEMRVIFAKYFRSISTGRIGDFYSISALLDPRYGHSLMIFSESDWKNVESKLVREASHNGIEMSKIRNQKIVLEVEKYKLAMSTDRPVFDELMTPARWWNAMEEELPMMYKKWIEYSCPPAVSIDGKRLFGRGGKLAHLFATLDEVLHHKATLLAQSSQDFVGRGNASILIFDQIRDVTVTFRRLEDEPDDDGEDVLDEKPEIQQEELVIKQEMPDDYNAPEDDAPEVLRDVKLEEPEDPEYDN